MFRNVVYKCNSEVREAWIGTKFYEAPQTADVFPCESISLKVGGQLHSIRFGKCVMSNYPGAAGRLKENISRQIVWHPLIFTVNRCHGSRQWRVWCLSLVWSRSSRLISHLLITLIRRQAALLALPGTDGVFDLRASDFHLVHRRESAASLSVLLWINSCVTLYTAAVSVSAASQSGWSHHRASLSSLLPLYHLHCADKKCFKWSSTEFPLPFLCLRSPCPQVGIQD